MNKGLEVTAIICLIVIAGVAGMWGYQNLVVHPPVAPPTSAIREGFIAVTFSPTEPSTGAILTLTAPVYTLWHLANPGAFPIVSKNELIGAVTGATATTFGISSKDNVAVAGGYKQYFVIQVYPGTAHYLDMVNMISRNIGTVVNSQTNIDMGSDGYPDILFLVDVTGQTLSALQATPSPVSIMGYCLLMDTTTSLADPADINVAGAGAASGSSILNFVVTVTTDASGDAFALGRIYLTLNDTEAYLTPRALTITAFDGTQTVISSPVSETVGSTTYIYYYPPSGNYRWTYNGLMMYRSTGSNTFVNIAWAFDYSFSNAGSGFTTIVTLYYDAVSTVSNGGTIVSRSDAVNVGNPS